MRLYVAWKAKEKTNAQHENIKVMIPVYHVKRKSSLYVIYGITQLFTAAVFALFSLQGARWSEATYHFRRRKFAEWKLVFRLTIAAYLIAAFNSSADDDA